MISAPVVVLPPLLEAWQEQGAQHAFVVHGAGSLERAAGRLQILGLQGTGVLGSRYVLRLTEVQALLHPSAPTAELLSMVREARGSLAVQAYAVDERAVYLLNDPMGGAPIYRYRAGGLQAFSSDLPSLLSVLRARGASLNSELRYFASGALTGTQTYGADSPYREIEVLRRGLGVRIDADGRIDEVQLLPGEMLYGRPEDRGVSFERLRSEVLENVRLASQADVSACYAHLTAGMDSRLVLSALLHEQLQDDFSFACIQASSDWGLASQLAGEFGLRFSDFEGNLRGKGHAINYLDWATRAARRSAGALVVGQDPRWLPADTLLLQGGYGELLRCFNSFLWDGKTEDLDGLALQLWRHADYPAPDQRENSIWAPEFLEAVRARLAIPVREAKELGLPADAFTSYLYAEGRNRYWFGLQSFYASNVRSQFDPLYSRHAAGLALDLDFERRKANFLGLDLMRSFAPMLLGYAFDRPCLTPAYECERGPVSRHNFSGRQPLPVEVSRVASKPWPGDVDLISSDDETEAKALGLMPLVLAGVRRHAGSAIEQVAGQQAFREVYRPERLAALWNGGRPQGRQAYQRLHAMLSSLLLAGWRP